MNKGTDGRGAAFRVTLNCCVTALFVFTGHGVVPCRARCHAWNIGRERMAGKTEGIGKRGETDTHTERQTDTGER